MTIAVLLTLMYICIRMYFIQQGKLKEMLGQAREGKPLPRRIETQQMIADALFISIPLLFMAVFIVGLIHLFEFVCRL